MAYLLVCTGHALGAESYGMALVETCPHQVRASTMEEAVGTLSTCISSGPNWPYVLAQLYEGSNHTPLQRLALRHPAPGKDGGEPLWAD